MQCGVQAANLSVYLLLLYIGLPAPVYKFPVDPYIYKKAQPCFAALVSHLIKNAAMSFTLQKFILKI